MNRPSLTSLARAAAAGVAALAIAGCAATTGANWTYAPLGPTPTPGPSGGEATPGATPAGTVIEVSTPADNPLVFDPASLDAPAETDITVSYTNDSSVQHNIQFFNGADSSAPSLGKTAIVTGPSATETVTFTTPGAGDYYFWCDVHLAAMSGMLHVQ